MIDFGIARAWGAVHQAASRVIGSAHFMAPEQVDNRPLGPAVDMFSWGATMVFAATGRYAFDGSNPIAVGLNVLQGEPDLQGLGGALGDLVRACLAKDPERRPTAAQVRQALMAPADRPAEPVTGPPAAPAGLPPETVLPVAESVPAAPAGRPRRRGRRVLAGLLVLVLLAGAGAAYGWWERGRDRSRWAADAQTDPHVRELQKFDPKRKFSECSLLRPLAGRLTRRSCRVGNVEVTYSLFQREPVDERALEREKVERIHDGSPDTCRSGTGITPQGRRGRYIEYKYRDSDNHRWYAAVWFDDSESNENGSAVMTLRREWDEKASDPVKPLRDAWLSWGYRLEE